MRDKQIEEISCNRCVHYEVCMYVNAKAVEFARAENCKLFKDNADYRKQIEGEWVLCGIFDDFLKCSICGDDHPLFSAINYNFCPHCGAKMSKMKGD